jgi:hypothetical protein
MTSTASDDNPKRKLAWEGIESDGPYEKVRVWLERPQAIIKEDGTEQPRTPEDLHWRPLRHVDCGALNAVAGSKPVRIEGGRATADSITGLIFDNFLQKVQPRELTSAVWFVREEKSSKEKLLLHPLTNEADVDKIESLFQNTQLLLAEGVDVLESPEATLSDQSRVRVAVHGNSLLLQRIPNGWFSAPQVLQRGYGTYTVAGETAELALGPVTSLWFLVHGVGEAYFAKESVRLPSIVEQSRATRVALNEKQHQEWRERCQVAQKAGLPVPPPPGRIELLPIEWFHSLHDGQSDLIKSLQAVTLSSIPALRSIANDVILDVLVYLTPHHCQAVLECVTEQLCTLHAAFTKVHPHFNGPVSLMGHSLGSVICWDLLAIQHDRQQQQEGQENGVGLQEPAGVLIQGATTTAATASTWGPNLVHPLKQSLPFTPTNVVFLGSPVGMFLSLRGARKIFDDLRGDETVSPFCLPVTRLYNIFNSSDPVAYRIEPLLVSPDIAKADLPPPVYLTASPGKDVRLHVRAKQLGDGLRKSLLDPTSMWSAVLSSVTAPVYSTGSTQAEAATSFPSTKPEAWKFPLGGQSDRVDFALQPALVDNEYISAVLAHVSPLTIPNRLSLTYSLCKPSL